jgi:hypothetical protein
MIPYAMNICVLYDYHKILKSPLQKSHDLSLQMPDLMPNVCLGLRDTTGKKQTPSWSSGSLYYNGVYYNSVIKTLSGDK